MREPQVQDMFRQRAQVGGPDDEPVGDAQDAASVESFVQDPVFENLHPFDLAMILAAMYSWCLWMRQRRWFELLSRVQPSFDRSRYLITASFRGWFGVMLKYQSLSTTGATCFKALQPCNSFTEFIPRGPRRRNLFHRVCLRWIMLARRRTVLIANGDRVHKAMCRLRMSRVFNEWYYYTRWIMSNVYIMIAKYQSFDREVSLAASAGKFLVNHKPVSPSDVATDRRLQSRGPAR